MRERCVMVDEVELGFLVSMGVIRPRTLPPFRFDRVRALVLSEVRNRML